jgi:hypothetical protein
MKIENVCFEVFKEYRHRRHGHLEGWVMLYNTPPCYITGCYVAFMLFNTFLMLYNIPGCAI